MKNLGCFVPSKFFILSETRREVRGTFWGIAKSNSSPTLSKDNWQEEIKRDEEYAACVKRLSPGIYKEVIDKRMETLKMWGLLARKGK